MKFLHSLSKLLTKADHGELTMYFVIPRATTGQEKSYTDRTKKYEKLNEIIIQKKSEKENQRSEK